MGIFPYKPRKPYVEPEAPTPETPQNSDWRLYNAMLRIGFGAAIIVALYTAAFARGRTQGLGGLFSMLLALVYLAAPDFRDRIHGSNEPWWMDDGDDLP